MLSAVGVPEHHAGREEQRPLLVEALHRFPCVRTLRVAASILAVEPRRPLIVLCRIRCLL